jgi:hypothetical protein
VRGASCAVFLAPFSLVRGRPHSPLPGPDASMDHGCWTGGAGKAVVTAKPTRTGEIRVATHPKAEQSVQFRSDAAEPARQRCSIGVVTRASENWLNPLKGLVMLADHREKSAERETSNRRSIFSRTPFH